jgi:hypothetical protein
MQTYWVAVGSREKDYQQKVKDGPVLRLGNYPAVCAKTARLVMWNVDVLATLF